MKKKEENTQDKKEFLVASRIIRLANGAEQSREENGEEEPKAEEGLSAERNRNSSTDAKWNSSANFECEIECKARVGEYNHISWS